MGVQFLRHIERTAVLVHLIDISREDYVSAWNDYETINNELKQFSPALLEKPQIVAINKMDLPVTRERIEKDIDIFRGKGIEVFAFSAVTGEGMEAVLSRIINLINRVRPSQE